MATATAERNRVNGAVHPYWYKDLMVGDWAKLGDVAVGRVDITPEVAGIILDHHNTRNRNPVVGQIAMLARDMAEGNFLFSGETIIFDRNKTLVNGQNRLRACLTSQKEFQTLVVVGVDSQVFKVLDQQARRTAGQILSMIGEVNANNLSSAISYLQRLLTHGDLMVSRTGGRTGGLTVSERLEVLRVHPGIRDAVQFFFKNKKSVRMFPGIGIPSALYFLTDFAHRNISREFWNGLMNYTPPEGDRWQGVSLLMKRLINNMSDQSKLNGRVIAAMTIKAWNAAVDSEPMKTIRFNDTEEFPRIAGLKYEGNAIAL